MVVETKKLHPVKQRELQKVYDSFESPEFEKKMYDKYGVDSQFVGHPLLAQIPPKADKDKFFEEKFAYIPVFTNRS